MPAAPLVGAVTTRPPHRVLLVHGQGVQVHPVQDGQRIAQRRFGLTGQLPVELRRSARHAEPGQLAVASQPRRTHGCIASQIERDGVTAEQVQPARSGNGSDALRQEVDVVAAVAAAGRIASAGTIAERPRQAPATRHTPRARRPS